MRAELVLVDLAGLDPAELGARLGITAEEVEEGLGLEPLVLAEAAEGLEDVRRQHAAEVDEQAMRSAHERGYLERRLGERRHALVEEPEERRRRRCRRRSACSCPP